MSRLPLRDKQHGRAPESEGWRVSRTKEGGGYATERVPPDQEEVAGSRALKRTVGCLGPA